ncbi:MAG: phage major capsid protein [Methylobacteriaceae bacterium]|nr:phage major capsid protein [Methylobacteriaceae bacterium]
MHINAHPRLETKSAESAVAIEDFNRAFESYKETNDLKLAQIEAKLGPDVVTTEKLARIDAALDSQKRVLDRMNLERARPALGGGRGDHLGHEHKAAFGLYMRAGEAPGLKALEEKALSVGSGPDGGYLVPQPVEEEILKRMAHISPIRSIASVREISASSLRMAFSTAGPATGWVGETDPRPQTATQTIADMTFPAMELYAMPAATQTLLDDAVVDIEQWIADEVSVVFAEQEGSAFVNGDGVNKPKGFLSYTKVAQGSWIWGDIGYIASGAAGAFSDTNPSDELFDLIYSLRAGYRQNARFVMNRKTQAAIRKFKTGDGDYIWQPPTSADAHATLIGFPVVEAEDMPDIAANSSAIAFGDFQRGYVVVDRLGIRILRDPFSAKPYVLFYTTKRVGGGVQDFDAIKLMKFAVT